MPWPASDLADSALRDQQLVHRSLARDADAFRTIMQRHNRRLYRVARSVVRNDDEAEDVVQEAYTLAFTHLASYRGDSGLASWLARITMNEALGRLRRQRPTVDLQALDRRARPSPPIRRSRTLLIRPSSSMSRPRSRRWRYPKTTPFVPSRPTCCAIMRPSTNKRWIYSRE